MKLPTELFTTKQREPVRRSKQRAEHQAPAELRAKVVQGLVAGRLETQGILMPESGQQDLFAPLAKRN